VTAQGLLHMTTLASLQVARLGPTTSPDGVSSHSSGWRGLGTVSGEG
jgi:hypothetical protein